RPIGARLKGRPRCGTLASRTSRSSGVAPTVGTGGGCHWDSSFLNCETAEAWRPDMPSKGGARFNRIFILLKPDLPLSSWMAAIPTAQKADTRGATHSSSSRHPVVIVRLGRTISFSAMNTDLFVEADGQGP